MSELIVTIKQGMSGSPTKVEDKPEVKKPETDKQDPKEVAIAHLKAADEALKQSDFNVKETIDYIDMAIKSLNNDADIPEKKKDILADMEE